MKKQTIVTATVLAAFAAMPIITNAQISTTTTFGTIPGNPNGGNPYSGTGIPYNNSEVTTLGNVDSAYTITLAMSATQHGASNPAPGNNGAGTFYVNTGLAAGRSVWNYDFYIGNSGPSVNSGGVTYEIVEDNLGNSEVETYNPQLIGDNVGGPSGAGNSESLDFIEFGALLSYNPNLNDTYDFTLEALADGNVIGSSAITVVAGTGAAPAAVPEASTIMAGALMLLPFGVGGFRALRRKQAKA